MDHMMPGMDGIEAAAKIRALGTEYARAIPIIALTANAVVGTEELFYEEGFQAFITKPIDIMRLDSVIKQWIKDRSTDKAVNGSPYNLNALNTSAAGFLSEKEKIIIEIPGLNTEKGLAICDGDPKIYQATLRSYVADISVVLEKIHVGTEDTLPDYIIAVHGIKGSSANIGAEAIREAAAGLEEMAKNKDLLGILAKNGAFVQEAVSLVAEIKSWLAKQAEKINKPQLPAPDHALLARLRQSCEEYDMDSIEKVMDELDSANYDTDNDLVIWLREKVDTFNFTEIAERLE
jgi:CheY-like chemotaxis protein